VVGLGTRVVVGFSEVPADVVEEASEESEVVSSVVCKPTSQHCCALSRQRSLFKHCWKALQKTSPS